MHDSDPLADPQVQFQYKQMLASGQFMESVYNCEDCGYGGTALVHRAFVRELRCADCGSLNVYRSMLVF